MFSAYMLEPSYGWTAVHRLPLDSAIRFCKEYRKRRPQSNVAIVPDGEDPSPYLRVAEGQAHYGFANPRATFERRLA